MAIKIKLEKDGFIRKIVGMSSKENREKLIKKKNIEWS